MYHVVNGLLISDGKVPLARRSKQRKNYPDCWSFPGGHMEGAETHAFALARELSEEIGVLPLKFQKVGEIEAPAEGQLKRIFHLFAVTRWRGTPTIRDQEHVQLRWMEPDAAADLPDLALGEYVEVLRKLGDLQEQIGPANQDHQQT